MIIGKNNILAYFETVGKGYYAIFHKGKVSSGIPIFRNDKDSEKTFDFLEGKDSFKRILDLLEYGDYTLVVSDKKDVTTRGGNQEDFRINPNENAPAASVPAVSGIGSITMDQVEQKANEIADKRFSELMQKKELADTKSELEETKKLLREAEKSTQEPFNKLIGAMAPHSDAIISGLFGTRTKQAAVSLSGVKADEVAENDPELNKIFEDFAEVLITAKPTEWKAIVIKLTELIKNDPAKFEMALKLL